MITHDLEVPGGTLRWYDSGVPDDGPAGSTITAMWHHGTPNTGEPPAPLLEASAKRGIRWLGFDRPGYGGSSAMEGRRVADAARLAALVADAAGVETVVAVGHSGGGSQALACGALWEGRASAVVVIAGLAPYTPDDPAWFAGMHAGGEAELRAALEGPSRLATLMAATEFDAEMFTPEDQEVLKGEWSWFNRVAAAGIALGLDGAIADNVAYVNPWGFDRGEVGVPTLLVHGGLDRIVPVAHARWNAEALPHAELWELPGEGHLSVLRESERILDWMVQSQRPASCASDTTVIPSRLWR